MNGSRVKGRFQVVSNFGNSGEIHACTHENGLPRRDASQGKTNFRHLSL